MPRTTKPKTAVAATAAATVKPARARKPRQPKGAAARAAKPPASPAVTASPAVPAARASKADAVIAMLNRPGGVSVDEVMVATGWQRHSVRGAFAGTIKKKLGSALVSEVVEGVRRYRAPEVSA